MNQYDFQNAVERIDGYYVKTPLLSDEETFKKAKDECLKNMHKAIEQTESITFEAFAREKKIFKARG